jgi:RimJ/RimL family protein N-acetyltransferase
MAAIAFRRLSADDLQSLYLWLDRPHVAKWYAPAPSSYAEMAAKYAPRTEASSVVRSFIVCVDGVDCGYAQAYPVDAFPDYAAALSCGEGAWGVDLFIADPWRLGRGLGTEVIRRFCSDIVRGECGARECVADPAEGNAASLRAFEKAGFERGNEIRIEGEEPRRAMRLAAA